MNSIRLTDSVKTEEIYVFPFNPREYPINIEVCGTTVSTASYLTTNNPCRSYIFEYIVKGEGTLTYNGKVYHPREGDLYILSKGSNNSYYPDVANPWTKLWINLDGALIPNLLGAYGLLDTVLVKGFQNETLFRGFMDLMVKDIPREELVFQTGLKLHELLQKIYRLHNQKIIKSDAAAIRRILDTQIYQPDFTMSSLADSLHMSQAQIIGIFKEKYKMTPYHYLLEQRIRISASMLLNTQLSIKEISEALNFADQHYYSNVFKRIIGKSPQQYRIENQRIYSEIVDDKNKRNYTALRRQDGGEPPP